MPIAAARRRTARTAPSSAACGSAQRSPSPEIPPFLSTRASSASRVSPPPECSATAIGSPLRWCAPRAASWSPPLGRRRSPAWPSAWSGRARTSAPTRSASSAAGRSPTRRPTCWENSPASRWALRTSTTTAASACPRRRPPRCAPSGSTAVCPSRSRTSARPTPCSWWEATRPRPCHPSCNTSTRRGQGAASSSWSTPCALQPLRRPLFIEERTEGFAQVKATVAGYWPDRVERITGVSEAQLVQSARILGCARSPMVLTGRGPEQQAQGVANTLAFINIALALGKPGRPFAGYGCLTGQGNGQGGREHGQKADQLPGYRRIDDPAARRHLAQVWDVKEEAIPGPGRSGYELLSSLGEPGGVRALLVVGSNPVVSAPDAGRIEARLRSLDFLAVADFFLSETAALAHVVLPSAQWAEEEGTMTNLEGRVVRRRRAQPPPPGVRTDVEMLCDIAARLGHAHRFSYAGSRDVFEELGRASQGGPADYSGISYEKIEAQGGVFWPCPAKDHPGTPRPFATSFATPSGRARFHSVRHGPPAEEPDSDYPLYLTTGRLLAHYQSGTQTRRVAELVRLSPAPVARIHPQTAHRHGLADGDPVTLSTRRGSARFTVESSALVREDTIFVSFHWEGANRLTNAALDPVSRMPEFKVCAVRIEGG